MTLRIAICLEDLETAPRLEERLQALLPPQGIVPEVHCFDTAAELAAEAQRQPFAVFFLGIALPGADGIELAEKLARIRPELWQTLIFVSDREDEVFRAICAQPWCFVRQRCFEEEIRQTIQSIIDKYQAEQPAELLVRANGNMLVLRVPSIQFVESINKAQVIHTTSQPYTVYSRIGDLERKLQPYGFLRVHKSYLLNIRYVQRVTGNAVILDSGVEIPMSKYRAAEVRRRLREHME